MGLLNHKYFIFIFCWKSRTVQWYIVYYHNIQLALNLVFPCTYTIVWKKFDVKRISSLVWHDENWMHEIFLTINKKVTFLFIGDSKGRKYFTMNKFHTKIFNDEFFPNYSMRYWDIYSLENANAPHVECCTANNKCSKVRMWSDQIIIADYCP